MAQKHFDTKRVLQAIGLVDHAITLLHPGRTYIVPKIKDSRERMTATKVMLTCQDIQSWCSQKKRRATNG